MPKTIGDTDSRGRARPCAHLAAIRPVAPHSTGCEQCLRHGDGWLELCLCLSCGWVACSDDSAGHHAKEHYEETDHPIAMTREIRWCYVHQRAV